MIRTRAVHPGRVATLAVTLLAALLLAGGSTLAATPISYAGTWGNLRFGDTSSAPGASCLYDGTAGHQELAHVKVKAPAVYWMTTGATHSGTIGFLVKLQHWDGSHWRTVYITSESTAVATRTKAAPLSSRRTVRPEQHSRRYRIVVRLRWLTPDGHVLGIAYVRIDHYRRSYDGSVGGSCKAEVADRSSVSGRAP